MKNNQRRDYMIKLNSKEFKKIIPLVKSQNELSVFTVINGDMPGEIYVNNIDNPSAALIKTSECNLITGSSNDEVFNSEVSSKLDFGDQLTPDSGEWMDKIPIIHRNQFIRKYKRRRYVLSRDEFVECDTTLRKGYVIEKVDISLLRQNSFENSKKLLEWIENWGNDENFEDCGVGYFVRNDKTIVSWSLSDCSFDKKIAIGIHTDKRYRKNGFGKIVASATISGCFAKGYEKIEWLCVDSNKGSIALAENLGFKCSNYYYSFSSYPPIENLKDLSEAEWHEWGEYLEYAYKIEECLIWDCLYCYIKSNDVKKTIDIMTIMKHKKITIDYIKIKSYITTLQTYGICSNFTKKEWINFINENISIETENLIIRPFLPSDVKDAVYYSQQPNVSYWLSDMVLHNELEALSWINWLNEKFNVNEPFIILAIEYKVEHKCIGVVGVHAKAEIDNEVEILYGISDSYQGNGYATEAAKALIQWVFENTELKSLTAIVKPENTSSKTVINKLGFNYVDDRVVLYDGEMCKFDYYKLYNSHS